MSENDADRTEAAEGEAAKSEDALGEESGLKGGIIEALRGVYDPEIPVNIYDLGLIYDVKASEAGEVRIEMTLTSPGCPVAGEMPGMVKEAVESVEGVKAVEVELVWDPPWDASKMSEVARIETGMW